ncbi:hypothetical protein [Burkholderia gladioli]|uniref:hypothetical protein n=1 Tax=Burkholderia gladioli TaxID=28095 RepID=UPI0016402810|nr:hypothetical protein [Burkholderia gladioli]
MSDTQQFEKIEDSTQNVLKDFDIAVSLTLKSINVQLASAWQKWHHSTAGLNVCNKEVVKESEDGEADNDLHYRLDLRLQAPVVSVDPARQSLHDVIVTFEIASGAVAKTVGKRSASLDLTGLKFWFTATLVQNEVRPEQLYSLDAQTARTVAALSGSQGAGAFTIECLFLNLTTLDIVSGFGLSVPGVEQSAQRFRHAGYAEKFLARPENIVALRQELEDQFALFMRDYFARDRTPDGNPVGRFLLNTTMRPHAPKVEPSLSINDLRFKVTRPPAHAAEASPSSLDYLCTVVDGRPMPAHGGPLDNALSALGSWLTPDRVEGRQATAAGAMVLRSGRVARLLAEIFHKALPEQYDAMEQANQAAEAKLGRKVTKPEVEYPYPEHHLLLTETPGWDDTTGKVSIRSSPAQNRYEWEGREDDNKVKFLLQKSLSLDLTPSTGEGYTVSGAFVIELSRKRDTAWGNTDAWAKTVVPIAGKLVFIANSDGVICEISPQITIEIGTPVQTSEASSSNVFVSVFNNDAWDRSQATGFSDAIREKIQRMLEEVFGKLNLRLKDFAIIPPGGEAFGFSKPRIGPGRDLLLDVVYRTSLKPK